MVQYQLNIYFLVATPHRNNDANTLLDQDIVDDTNGDFKHLLRAAACVSITISLTN